LCERNPRIAAAFWRDTLIDAAGFREWVTNIGQRCGPSRIAHLLCEFLVRMRAVGLADGHTCPMPMTQGQLAEATGLSAVHVNRSIQQLRSSRLISLSEQTLKVLDWPGLKKTADFDPLYLHLKEASSAVN
jgi:CRP-like cAMP-binding protein